MQILTKTDLDAWKCPDCVADDHPQHFTPDCCGGAPFRVSYDKRTSLLVLTCDNCEQAAFHIVLK
jgi:hypothetical protein